ncbi:MAG: hypothetical protein R2801_09225 [Chitinophagales bacterium]
MKKNLFILAILAVFSTVFITSCGDDEDQYACSVDEYVGVYNGSHSLKITTPISLDVPISDKITIAASGTSDVDVTSQTLGATFTGTISDCDIKVSNAHIDSFQTTVSGITAIVRDVTADLTVKKNITKSTVYTTIHVTSGTAEIAGNTVDLGADGGSTLSGTFK